jgi:hypothetical protein
MNLNSSDYSRLSDQAQDVPSSYLTSACYTLDKHFGEGYAKNNPELVGQIMNSMTVDFHSMAFAKTMTDFSERLAQVLS